ncbi:uncharacterized protein G2W53_033814 [Senna tora]|uniref:Uncharacterized protein n=1 Tax=Senna tora TaxID=362788 RepID=A0A834W8T8_9FABA|nr:uncharacterized protein G2W53_033814 [Senna tora]
MYLHCQPPPYRTPAPSSIFPSRCCLASPIAIGVQRTCAKRCRMDMEKRRRACKLNAHRSPDLSDTRFAVADADAAVESIATKL